MPIPRSPGIFCRAWALVAFTLVSGASAAAAIAAPALPQGEHVVYEAAGGLAFEGYYVDAGKTAPLVVIAHDWDGLTDYEIRRARMLAEQGYSVFALDLFGKGIRPTKMEDRRQHTGELYRDRAKMRAIMTAGLKSAGERGANLGNAVVIGYCFGGAAVLELARAGQALKGFVSIHGGLSTPAGQDYSKTQGQLLVQHGAADENISLADFAELAGQLEAHNVQHEMIAYGGAPHAWTVFGSERYRDVADQRSWTRLLGFLAEVLR